MKAKKFFLSILIVLLTCALVSCDAMPSNHTEVPTDNTQCTHSYYKVSTTATCFTDGTATFKCKLCEKSYTEHESALGHTTDNGKCSRCGQYFGGWEIAFYVDEFDNPTSKAYLRNKTLENGTFSNSATTDSELKAIILIDTDDVCIMLYEYGSSLVKAYTSTDYNITLLYDDGSKIYTYGTMYKNGNRITMNDWSLVKAIQKNQKVSIYIKENSKYGVNSTYLFTINQGDFNTIYNQFYDEYLSEKQ